MTRKTSGPSISVYFSIYFALTFIVASIVIVAIVNRSMRNEALSDAREKANVILERNLATHHYFSQELKPKLFDTFAGSQSPDYFEPTWMSSTYAIRQIDKYFNSNSEYSNYYYKECAVNARSPQNEADDYERAFIEELNKDPDLRQRSEIREFDGQAYFVSLHRGERMEQSCLRCHSTPDKAPGDLVKQYGDQRSFNRSDGNIVSAISVRIPLANAYAATRATTIKLSALLLAILSLMLTAIYIFTKKTVMLRASKLEDLNQQLVAEISERKEAEAKAERDARLTQILLDSMPCVAMLLSPKTRKIAALNETAYKAGARVGQTCFGSWARHDEHCPFCMAPELWESGVAQHIEVEFGGVFWDAHWLPISDDLYMHYAFDITDRKQTENALFQSEERFRRAIVDSPFPTMLHAEDGEILQINRVWTKLTGYEPEEIPTLSAWTERAYGERKDVVKSRIDNIFDCDTTVEEGEYVISSKDGRMLTWDFSSAPLGTLPDGRRLVISMATDVSERKQAENALQVKTHDLGERVKELNCLYGLSKLVDRYDSLEDILRELVEMIASGWQYPEVTCCKINALGNEYKSSGFEHTEWKQSATIIVNDQASGSIEVFYKRQCPQAYEGPFLKEERDLIDALAQRTSRIIERKQAEEKLADHKIHLEELVAKRTSELGATNKSLKKEITERKKLQDVQNQQFAQLAHMSRLTTAGELSSSLAHELNQPLCAIATISEGCKRLIASGKGGGDEITEGIEEISTQAARSGQIIRRMAQFVSKHSPKRSTVDIDTVINDSIGLIGVQARQSNVDIQYEQTGKPLDVLADKVQLQQVLINLMQNGIDAMENITPDQCRLSISVSIIENEYVEIAIEDNGRGFSETDKETLFEPFYTTKPEGMGIGLAISRSIVEAHDGYLSAESESGDGATFRIKLPLSGHEKTHDKS